MNVPLGSFKPASTYCRWVSENFDLHAREQRIGSISRLIYLSIFYWLFLSSPYQSLPDCWVSEADFKTEKESNPRSIGPSKTQHKLNSEAAPLAITVQLANTGPPKAKKTAKPFKSSREKKSKPRRESSRANRNAGTFKLGR